MTPVSGLSMIVPTTPQIQQQFHKLNNDLEAGNFNAAQSDFVSIQTDTTPSAAASSQSANPSVPPISVSADHSKFETSPGTFSTSV